MLRSHERKLECVVVVPDGRIVCLCTLAAWVLSVCVQHVPVGSLTILSPSVINRVDSGLEECAAVDTTTTRT